MQRKKTIEREKKMNHWKNDKSLAAVAHTTHFTERIETYFLESGHESEQVIRGKQGINQRYRPSVGSKATTAGITLVALVVTIVVLMILAGNTINMVFSNNGVINQAQQAGEAQRAAEARDRGAIQGLSDSIQSVTGNR